MIRQALRDWRLNELMVIEGQCADSMFLGLPHNLAMELYPRDWTCSKDPWRAVAQSFEFHLRHQRFSYWKVHIPTWSYGQRLIGENAYRSVSCLARRREKL